MSLLTKEQQDKVERLRGYIEMPVRGKKSGRLAQSYSRNLLVHARSLLSIIDDLQARAPKQYTEQELREWFENRPLVQDEIDALLHEVVPGENEAWYSVLKFAAHVGALKAEP